MGSRTHDQPPEEGKHRAGIHQAVGLNRIPLMCRTTGRARASGVKPMAGDTCAHGGLSGVRGITLHGETSVANPEKTLVRLHAQFGDEVVAKGIAELRMSQRILNRRLQITQFAAAIIAFALEAIGQHLFLQ
jgi:hypothetical protein